MYLDVSFEVTMPEAHLHSLAQVIAATLEPLLGLGSVSTDGGRTSFSITSRYIFPVVMLLSLLRVTSK